MMQKMRTALGLGSNLGDRAEILRTAVKIITTEFLTNAQVSSLYETPPWGVLDQPDFLNLVVVGDSEWKPPAMLNYVKDLERELGRVPSIPNGPRLIDIDILAFGETVWNSPEVVVPHPRLHDREFVLAPLCEIWPEWRHPSLGKTAEALLADYLHSHRAVARKLD